MRKKKRVIGEVSGTLGGVLAGAAIGAKVGSGLGIAGGGVAMAATVPFCVVGGALLGLIGNRSGHIIDDIIDDTDN